MRNYITTEAGIARYSYSAADLSQVLAIIEALNPSGAYTYPGDLYTGFVNSDNVVIAYVSATKVTIPKRAGFVPQGDNVQPASEHIEKGGWDVLLSTYQGRDSDGGAKARLPLGAVCPTCFLTMGVAETECSECDA